MSDPTAVSNHYTLGSLLEEIQAGVTKLGKDIDTITVDDLAPLDEFHTGGRAATETFLSQLGLTSDYHVLDVGCGLGGGCRFVAERFGSRVTGIDLTPEYIETGRVLCSWVRLADRIDLDEGSATSMPYSDGSFDKAYMMHVGMNIADKALLMSEIGRVLKPGGQLGIYDVMKTGRGELAFPVPWSTVPDTSFVESPEVYKRALLDAGFRITAERNRSDFALEFFERLKAKATSGEGPPPLGLHILLGRARADKVKNVIEKISAGVIAPIELFAEKVH